ncbi:DUF3093 domain-containing protein [Motilibacter aurantiacus]|uniref:DUF3093 domain-containing protein n=1 Tax=Motilibacter aurantiacus TaxID=2714955 RepID=UPI001408ABA0|nr:DUF3093 domain-containing protein [Motilibacter aurantiacus]
MVHDERLSAPPGVWLVGLLLAASTAPVTAVVLPSWGVVLVVLVVALAVGLLIRSWAAPVSVRDGELRAGRAHIPAALLGPAEALDDEAAAHLRGPGIEPRAYHLIRPWVRGAVRVEVLDPEDPTPYWYVATRHPAKLAAAIDAARAGARPA